MSPRECCSPNLILSGRTHANALAVLIVFASQIVDVLDELRIEVGLLIGPVLRPAGSRKRSPHVRVTVIASGLACPEPVKPSHEKSIEEHSKPELLGRIKGVRIEQALPVKFCDLGILNQFGPPGVPVFENCSPLGVPERARVLANLES